MVEVGTRRPKASTSRSPRAASSAGLDAREGEAAGRHPREPVAAGALSGRLGRYRDPWFGEATVCEADGGVRFESLKSPRLAGPVLRAGDRLLVDFDTLGADADAWLDFAAGTDGGPATLAMAKVDPEADFSYDYEDLAFRRIGDCP